MIAAILLLALANRSVVAFLCAVSSDLMGRAPGYTGPDKPSKSHESPRLTVGGLFVVQARHRARPWQPAFRLPSMKSTARAPGSLTRTPDRSLGRRSACRTVAQPAGFGNKARIHARTRRYALREQGLRRKGSDDHHPQAPRTETALVPRQPYPAGSNPASTPRP